MVERHFLFWLAVLVLVVLALWLLSEILLPFVAGLAIAYLLTPLTDRLERFGINRLAAALLIIALVVLALVYLILLVAPIVARSCPPLSTACRATSQDYRRFWGDRSRPWLQKLLGAGFSADKSMGDIGDARCRLADDVLALAMVRRPGALRLFILTCRRNARGCLLLDLRLAPHDPQRRQLDFDPVSRHGARACPRSGRCDRRLRARADRGVPYTGSYYAVALTLTGLNFGLLIGLISGLITFIPYVGSMTGLVLALGVAVAQFWPAYGLIFIVLGIFLVGQFVEGNVLAPKLVGESVGIHPVWLIFALLAFGYLFGFVGLLVAVPLAATIGVLARFALRHYLQSSLYTGEEAE